MIAILIVLTCLVAFLAYVQMHRQNVVKDKAIKFIKNMETTVDEAIDEGLDEAFGEDSELDDFMQASFELQREGVDEQRKTNILLHQIKTILEKSNVSIN